jgi:zinc protease
LEASRFKNLKLDRKTFQVEAGAVLGEYRRIFSDPGEKMIEEMSPVAFPHHPYGHTVIGYAKDVENMPNAWDAAWEFYGNYYKPNNVGLIVVGDVDPKVVFAQVEKNYGDWQPSHPPQIPAEQPPQGPKSVHVNWEADVSPRLVVGYHTPAMHPGSKETAITMLLPELLVSRSAPLFQKLRYQKQTVTNFSILDGSELLQSTDPHLLLLDSELMLDRFRKEGQPYVADVQKDVISGVDALQHFSQQPGSARVLKVVKSKVRNDFLAGLDSTYDIAQTFAWYYRFNRDPAAIDQLMQGIDSLSPRDIDAYAQKYFTPQGRIVTTLWQGPAPGSSASAPAPGVK